MKACKLEEPKLPQSPGGAVKHCLLLKLFTAQTHTSSKIAKGEDIPASFSSWKMNGKCHCVFIGPVLFWELSLSYEQLLCQRKSEVRLSCMQTSVGTAAA